MVLIHLGATIFFGEDDKYGNLWVRLALCGTGLSDLRKPLGSTTRRHGHNSYSFKCVIEKKNDTYAETHKLYTSLFTLLATAGARRSPYLLLESPLF